MKQKRRNPILLICLVVAAVLLLVGAGWFAGRSLAKSKEVVVQLPPEEPKYLEISEWGVQLPYPQGTQKLSYRFDTDAAGFPQMVTIIFDDFASDACTPGTTLARAGADQNLVGLTSTVTSTVYQQEHPESVVQVGDYYYTFMHGSVGCAVSDSVQASIDNLSAHFSGEAVKKVTAVN